MTNWTTLCVVIIIVKINPSWAHGQILKPFANNEYYIDSEQKYSWIESLIACMEINMTFVTIDSSTKSDEINTIVRNKFGNVKLWIGGIMTRFPNRHFVWLATGKPSSYANWHLANCLGKIEYCAHIGKGKNIEWNDLSCTHHQGFICEKNQQQMELDEKKTQPELQKQLQQTREEQQVFEKQMWDRQRQQDSLRQELEKVKQRAEQEIRKHQQLQQHLKTEIDRQQNKLQQDLQKFDKLQQDLEKAWETHHNLQHDFLEQQTLQQLLQEELNKLKKNQQRPSTEINRKYQEIVFDFDFFSKLINSGK